MKTIRGTLRNGSLYGPGAQLPGLDLSALVPYGRTEIGFLSTSQNTEVLKNDTLKIGLSITRNAHSETNLYKWDSKHYATLQTDGSGKFIATSDKSTKI